MIDEQPPTPTEGSLLWLSPWRPTGGWGSLGRCYTDPQSAVLEEWRTAGPKSHARKGQRALGVRVCVWRGFKYISIGWESCGIHTAWLLDQVRFLKSKFSPFPSCLYQILPPLCSCLQPFGLNTHGQSCVSQSPTKLCFITTNVYHYCFAIVLSSNLTIIRQRELGLTMRWPFAKGPRGTFQQQQKLYDFFGLAPHQG